MGWVVGDCWVVVGGWVVGGGWWVRGWMAVEGGREGRQVGVDGGGVRLVVCWEWAGVA